MLSSALEVNFKQPSVDLSILSVKYKVDHVKGRGDPEILSLSEEH